jgi:hypothetical protein
VSISPNPDPAVNPNYPSYGYMGGGPVFRVPADMPGAGNLLVVYHAELPDDALYAALDLAESTDNGLHWTDLGEIIRLNQAYAVGLDGFEIGDGPLVLSPDRKYFYLYFPDWLANGTLHTTTPAGALTTTNVSVARALVSSVLDAAFVSPHPRAVPFQKFYRGDWHLQPAIGGASTDLNPKSAYQGYLDIHYSDAIQRYVMIISDDTTFAYSESVNGLTWTWPIPPPWDSAKIRTFSAALSTCTSLIYPARVGRAARCGGSPLLANSPSANAFSLIRVQGAVPFPNR